MSKIKILHFHRSHNFTVIFRIPFPKAVIFESAGPPLPGGAPPMHDTDRGPASPLAPAALPTTAPADDLADITYQLLDSSFMFTQVSNYQKNGLPRHGHGIRRACRLIATPVVRPATD